MPTQNVPLLVIAEPEEGTRAVFVLTDDAAAAAYPIKGGAKIPYRLVCGACGRWLVGGFQRAQMNGVVIRCPECGAFNDTAIQPSSGEQ